MRTGLLVQEEIRGDTYAASKTTALHVHNNILKMLEGSEVDSRTLFGVRLSLEELLINGIKHGNYEVQSGEESEDMFQSKSVPPYNQRALFVEVLETCLEPGEADNVLLQNVGENLSSHLQTSDEESRQEQQELKLKRRKEANAVLTIVVQDEGPGFDPNTVKDATQEENLEVPSGRGLMLVTSFMDSLLFERNEIGMRVTCQIAIVRAKVAAIQ